MKKIVYLVIILLISKITVAQSNLELQLMSDSAETSMLITIMEIETFYDGKFNKCPDSTITKYYKTLDALAYRKLLLKKYEEMKWNNTNDSLIKLKIVSCKPQYKLGFGLIDNQVFFSAQYAFTANWYRNYDIGIGSGIEYVNRGSGLVHVVQIPIYITNNLFLGKFTFLNFDYGINIPFSGNYQNANNNIIVYKQYEFSNNMYFDLGLGYLNKSNMGIQFNARNQSLGVPEPLNQRVWMFGLKLSF